CVGVLGAVSDGRDLEGVAGGEGVGPRGHKKGSSSVYDELCAGWYPGLPEERHAGLGRGAVAFPLVAGGVGGHGVQPLGAAAPGSGLNMIHGVGVVETAVRAAELVPPEDAVLAVLHPAGRVPPV